MLGGINNGLYLISLSGFLIVGVMALILKWAFARGKSVIERTPKIGGEDEYGSLVVVASPNNHIEGEILRLKLVDAKIKATLTQTKDGPRVFVFASDEKIARAILKS